MRLPSSFCAVLPFLLPSAMAASDGAKVASSQNLKVDDLVRVRASMNPNESTIIEWQGQVLMYKPGEAPRVVFNVQGMNAARAVRLDSGGYDLLSRELQVYLHPVTNEVLHTWHNPFSNQDVTVVHVANNAVYQSFPGTAQYQARHLTGQSYTFQINIPLAYPNPLNPTGDPNSPLAVYQGSFQKLYTAVEAFTFTYDGSELAAQRDSVGSTQVQWTRTSPLLPWMATPDTNSTLLFVATGAKVKDGWRGLSSVLRDLIDTKVPIYKEAPVQRNSPGGGVTSWSYFTRPDVLQAYSDGVEFPLPDAGLPA